MRLALLAAVGLFVVSPAHAQSAQPSLRSTYVVPSMPGEAVRITVYARRPPQQGRLARRYRGLRANLSPQRGYRAVPAQAAAPLVQSPRHQFVRRNGSYFPVVPRR